DRGSAQGFLRLSGAEHNLAGAEAGGRQRARCRLRVGNDMLVGDDKSQHASATLPGKRAQPGCLIARHDDVVAALSEIHANRFGSHLACHDTGRGSGKLAPSATERARASSALDAYFAVPIFAVEETPRQQVRPLVGFLFGVLCEKNHKLACGGFGEMDFKLATYYPIFLYLLAIVAFSVAALVAAHSIGPWKKTPVKLMPYESGMDPIGTARRQYDVKFYLIAILFLVFDVELLFLYPWAVIAYRLDAPLPEPL